MKQTVENILGKFIEIEVKCPKTKMNNTGREIDFQPTEFLDYKESIKKMEKIVKSLLGHISGDHCFSVAPLTALAAVLKAQLEIIKYLNDENLNCGLVWDKRTGLPSHPSIIADAQKYVEIFKPPEKLKSVLESFSHWSLFSQGEFECCCGRGLRLRPVRLDIMLNHSLGAETAEPGLVIKQLLGVKSDDRRHLEYHYDAKRESRVCDDLVIIFESKNKFSLEKYRLRPISAEQVQLQSSYFSLEEYRRRFLALRPMIENFAV